MADRRRAGTLIFAAGLVLVGIGTVGLVLTGGDAGTTARPIASASPAGSATPTPSLAPTATPTAPPTPVPSPSPSPDAETLVAAFFADLVEAIRAGSVGSMADRLHPAVIDRYGEAACDGELAARAADPGFDVAIAAVRAPAPWDYVTDGRTTTIEETLTVDASVTSGGATTVRELHVAIVDGAVRWFTDCGSPLGAPPSP